MIKNRFDQREANVKAALNKYNELRRKNLILKDELGYGGCAVVYEVYDPAQKKSLVMKAVDTAIHNISNCTVSYMNERTKTEISALKECRNCEYVIDIIDAFEFLIDEKTDERVYLIFLPKLIVSSEYIHEKNYSNDTILSMAKDICKALDFCHSKGILHRDVKAPNIFFSPDKNHFVLSDFGVSKSEFDVMEAVTPIGSYLAPEIYFRHDLKGRFNSDIYSLGITMLLLFGGNTQIFNELKKRLENLKPEKLRVIISKATASDPAIRYQTAKELLRELESIKVYGEEHNVQHHDISDCVNNILSNNLSAAKILAKNGHDANNDLMTLLYAYLLNCENKRQEALGILRPLKQAGSAVAIGLYGIIARQEGLETKNKSLAEEGLVCIINSANKGFSVTQYFIGRWHIDGQAGIKKDIPKGLDYIFNSGKQGFRPALFYLREVFRRKNNEIQFVQAMIDLLEISLENFDESQFKYDMVLAIVTQ